MIVSLLWHLQSDGWHGDSGDGVENGNALYSLTQGEDGNVACGVKNKEL